MTRDEHGPLAPAARLAVHLQFRGSELCGIAGKLEVVRDRAERLALCAEARGHIEALMAEVSGYEAAVDGAWVDDGVVQ